MIRKLALASFFVGGLAFAEKAIPFLSAPVIDDVGILSASEKRELSEFILSQQSVVQMEVWITSLDGESIEGLSYRAAKQWALGTEKKDNGLLLVVAPAERRMRMEVGRGLEGDIPDILSARILDYVARPAFRQGQYYQGIRGSLNEVLVLAGGPSPAAQKVRERYSQDRGRGKSRDGIVILIILLFMFASPLLRFLFVMMGLSSGRRSSSYWSGGGSGWGGGGGGSWSGGGGSFGGGGSSSSW